MDDSGVPEKLDNKKKVTLSPTQHQSLELVKKGHNVFITGPGGTGKSYLIRYIVDELESEGKNVVVTASTGVAAFNIGGQTVHSWSGLGICQGRPKQILRNMIQKQDALKNIIAADMLLIDEISMLSPKFFVALDMIAKVARRTPNKPMGGLQIILIGDFLQLPPVPEKQTEHYPSKWEPYGITKETRFVFELELWNQLVDDVVLLSQPFRQENSQLFHMLNEVRLGQPSQTTMDRFYACGYTEFPKDNIQPTTLLVFCRAVDDINRSELAKLSGTSHFFDAKFGYTSTTEKDEMLDSEEMRRRKILVRQHIEGCTMARRVTQSATVKEPAKKKRKQDQTKTSVTKPEAKTFQFDVDVELKIDAQVMLAANLDFSKGLVNGTRGVVVRFENVEQKNVKPFQFGEETATMKCPVVKFTTNETRTIFPHKWKTEDRDVGEVWLSQFPLKLAWAATIHRAQGLSLSRAIIDLSGTFEYGQAYVALSRIRSLDGLKLIGLTQKSIRAHPVALKFYKDLINPASYNIDE